MYWGRYCLVGLAQLLAAALHGVPVAIKDDLEVAGLRFTCGSRLRAKVIGKSDDLMVARLRRAGAIILGKTNEPEFGHKGVGVPAMHLSSYPAASGGQGRR
jgi:Asp-tRNA(Asn)/Glu-tRNA(Gln) amidotransferase A subunit family amidase